MMVRKITLVTMLHFQKDRVLMSVHVLILPSICQHQMYKIVNLQELLQDIKDMKISTHVTVMPTTLQTVDQLSFRSAVLSRNTVQISILTKGPNIGQSHATC